jgi:DNA-binding transcriptional regulator YhcF (GntR family)
MTGLMITVDFDSDVPVYRQIADQIRVLMAQRQLTDGAELPSVRQLGEMVGVNQNTVARAYRILADEGLVKLRHGAGAKVRVPAAPYREPALADDHERRLHDVISRMVLDGVSRAEVERELGDAVRRFFEPPVE